MVAVVRPIRGSGLAKGNGKAFYTSPLDLTSSSGFALEQAGPKIGFNKENITSSLLRNRKPGVPFLIGRVLLEPVCALVTHFGAPKLKPGYLSCLQHILVNTAAKVAYANI